MNDKCVRCGNDGEDRRTLWMACFYSLEELGIPFKQQALFHADLEDLVKSTEATSIELPERDGFPAKTITIAPGTVRSYGELTPHRLYTLRVCKRCRGEWMEAIKTWFQAAPQGQDHDSDAVDPEAGCGSGIFIRENGSIKEITEEEWKKRAPNQEPLRIVKPEPVPEEQPEPKS